MPDNIEADLALNLALPVSHKVKRSPREVAQEIIKATDCSNLEWVITKQGYINILLPNIYYQELFKSTYQCQGNNLRGEKKNIRINIEYVSTNPTGYLHLAHFRHAFVGNSLANIYQFLGYQITREYYINDRGGQINSLIDSIYYFYQQSQGIIQKNAAKIEYPGQASQEIAQKLIEK